LGRRIDRQDFPRGERIGVALRIGENDELAWRELATMIKANRTGNEQRLTDRDGAVEERLAGPRTLEDAAVVAQDGMKDPQAPACRNDSLRHHLPHARDL